MSFSKGSSPEAPYRGVSSAIWVLTLVAISTVLIVLNPMRGFVSDMMRNGVPADVMTVFLVLLAGRTVRSVSVSLSKRAGQLRAFTKTIYTHDSDIILSWGTPGREMQSPSMASSH